MTVGPSESRVSFMSPPQCPTGSDLHEDRERATSPSPCPHLSVFRASNGGAKPFRALQNCLKIKQPGGRAAIRRDAAEVPQCGECGESFVPRLYACVNCAAVSSHSPSSSHAAAHSQRTMPGHEIFVDVDRAELFCCVCRDQIYDRDFDSAVVMAQTLTARGGDGHSPSLDNVRKRRRVDYRPWSPALQERLLMENLVNGASADFPPGLRGLNNLGSTCFMNSVLQALLHTAPLRNYFLSDKHNRDLCQHKTPLRLASSVQGGKRGGRGKGSAHVDNAQDAPKICLACDFDALFSAVFSGGDRMPYSPAMLLHSYEQQDAHEFFISILDSVHEMLENDHQKPQIAGISGCPPKTKVDYKTSKGISTLVGCLDRYTRAEKLGPDQKFFCQQCQERQESLKQMSIRKLPLVSCFHIKRFEHSPVRKMSSKVDRYLQFPFSLDMRPYLSSSVLRRRFGNRMFPFEEKDENNNVAYEVSSEFELFAVVTHTGKLESGHYITYLRLSNDWYKCDDAWITRVNEKIVRASQGYMIFYVQKMLSYKTNEKIVAETAG